MKIVVVNNAAPFVRGGAELLADKLVLELQRAGHDADLVRLPFAWYPPDAVVDSMASVASLRIPNCDRVIALKFPAYLVPHDDVVVWLLHQFRQVYDLWDHPVGWIADDRGAEVQRLVHTADRAALRQASALYCNSSVTQSRLRDHLGIQADVLLPPLLQDESFTVGPYGDYVVALGRISEGKRQHLAVEAMTHVPVDAGRLVIAGPPDTPEDETRLRDRVAALGLGDRVHVIAEFISEDHKRELLANARAVAYSPVDEDSYGYVTLEAAHAARPTVTTTDSGGILTLVEDDVTGMVVPPDPRAMGDAFARLLRDPQTSARLGAALHDRARDLGLTWRHVIDRLAA